MKHDGIKKQAPMEPTKAELEILQVLWQNGSSTVRFVNDTFNEQGREVKYTSTLKLMQIMTEKGILNRDDSAMKHVFSPAVEEKKMKNRLMDRIIDSMYNGSRSTLVMQLLGHKETSREELQEIKEFLNELQANEQSDIK